MVPRLNFFQPIYLEYTKALTEDITGWVMPFPNIEQFRSRYGEEQENAPTNSLINTIRLLLPQIRFINRRFIVNGQPNPAVFLAYKQIAPEALSLLFKKWVEVWYPESEHESLKSLCTPSQFNWQAATPEQLEWWSPAWSVAKHLSEQEYQLGDRQFKLLFAPGWKNNTVELVSWPPFTTPRGYKSSLGVVISHQSDFSDRRINLHFEMKRWIVKRGNNPDINLQSKTTHCYIRRLTSWLGDYDLLQPNAFTVLEAKNFRREGQNGSGSGNSTNGQEREYDRSWKDQKILEILDRLSVDIPNIENVLQNPLNYFETQQTNVLIPARSWQKAGWGTGFTIVDTRLLLKQIIGFLPAGATLTRPWQKISTIKNNSVIEDRVKDAAKTIKKQFIKNPDIKKPSQSQLPELPEDLINFLQQRANNITLHVCYRSPEVRAAIEQVANHYFGNSLNLEFHSSQSLADPITFEQSRRRNSRNRRIPQLQHIRNFGEENQPDNPEPIIVEILSQDHPSYRGDADPKSYIKSELPKYNLIPQCMVSSENIDQETNEATSDEDAENSLSNRALAAILDAIMPFDKNYPLTTSEDNNAYAGFYVISRNRTTSSQSFSEPVLVVIYKNEIKVLLPAQDTQLRSFPEAVCYLANNTRNTTRRDESTVNTMLEQLSINYSDADNIYLYAHAQNARTYWQWLQDRKFDIKKPPTENITIIRIRDLENNEIAQGYGLPVAEESFSEDFQQELASFAKGIFMPMNFNLEQIPLTQTVLSVAQKASTNQKQKYTSRFVSYTSKGETKNPSPGVKWKAPQPRVHNILATPSPDKFILHHAIAHHLRSSHWWSTDECEYPLPLSLAKKIKEWCFSQ